MSARSVFSTIELWISYGWLTQLDKAFVKFLLDQDANASDALLWAGTLVSHQLSRGEVYLDLKRLCTNPSLTLAIPSDEAWLPENQGNVLESWQFKHYALEDWLDSLQASNLVAQGTGNTPLVLRDNRLYLRRYWHYQQILDKEIGRRLSPIREHLPNSLQIPLAKLFKDSAEQPDWQKIACVLALRARFAIITGGPGTGKTTTLTKLLSLLIGLAAEEDQRKLTILLAAPTGKAATRVSESISHALEKLPMPEAIKQQIPKKACTLHRLLGSRPNSRLYKHHRNNPLLADIVIVDEASMIDLEMMASLLDALPPNSQLILLGDKDQLSSVEAGSVMGDLCHGAEHAAYDLTTRNWIESYTGETMLPSDTQGSALNQQTVMLRYSHRFGVESGIGQLARAVNTGNAQRARSIMADTNTHSDLNHILLPDIAAAPLKRLVTNAMGYGHYQHIMQRQRPSKAEFIPDWAQSVLQAFDRFQVLCALRRGDWGIEGLNERIEQWLFPDKKTGLWYEGRPVMVTRNDYNLGLMNGDIGITLKDTSGNLRVAFPADEDGSQNKIRWISPMRLPDVETAFAMTVHKSQGSEFDHVALLLPPIRSPVLTRELIYTAITRAKTSFTLLESRSGVFEQAILANAYSI